MDLLDRLNDRLRRAARQEHRGAGAVTVADIYQRLVPYRAVRGETGVMELAQYEHALLRLLSGERGYVQVESPEVRAEFARELRSPNPILGVYRDYAAVTVHLSDPQAQAQAPPVGAEPATPPEPAPLPPPPAPGPRPADPAPACAHCRAELPDLPGVRYCPACGGNQREVPCRDCGTPLQRDWNYCVSCGAPRRLPKAGA